MKTLSIIAVAMLTAGSAGSAQVGASSPSVGGSVSATTGSTGSQTTPGAGTTATPETTLGTTGNARGDRARTGRAAIGTDARVDPGSPSGTAAAQTGVPPLASDPSTSGASVDGDGSARTPGTIGTGGFPDGPR